jgi:3-hydroxyisobutyrate dehydrogenase-like beta-hydroxyacid dehydrogenase
MPTLRDAHGRRWGMAATTIGILHPGEMGASLAATARASGCDVLWASAGRSAATRARATDAGLTDVGSLQALVDRSDVIVAICPPHAAEDVAREVVGAGFGGLYVDANAIAPERAVRLERALTTAGVGFVDGGVIGPPAWDPGTTRLYLSGPRAPEVDVCFRSGPLDATVLDDRIGTASALKMCYAAYTKGSTALLCAVLATAAHAGVLAPLRERWDEDDPGFAGRTVDRAQRVTRKAWRFVGEMDEIAATFAAAGLPAGFHEGAGEVYRRLAAFKDAPIPDLDAVLRALLEPEQAAIDEAG